MISVGNIGCADRNCQINYYRSDYCSAPNIEVCNICKLEECDNYFNTDSLDYCFFTNCTLHHDAEKQVIYGLGSTIGKIFYYYSKTRTKRTTTTTMINYLKNS